MRGSDVLIRSSSSVISGSDSVSSAGTGATSGVVVVGGSEIGDGVSVVPMGGGGDGGGGRGAGGIGTVSG